MTISRSEACTRLSSLGIRQERVHQILDQVDTWEKKSGPEWTVQRLKSLKTDFVRQLAGLPKSSTWIAYNASGVPKGALGFLFKEKSKKGIVRALNALMVYSAYTADRVTPKQWNKFHSSVVNPIRALPGFSEADAELAAEWLRPSSRKAWSISLDEITLGNTYVPCPIGGRLKESEIDLWWPSCVTDGFARKLSQRYPDVFSGLLPDMKKFMSRMPNWDYQPSFGRIGFIQEAGFKLRAVANPDRVVQFALEPLRKEIAKVVRDLPNDFTYDQDAGVERIQGWIRDGRKVHSVDLSDATNNFPFDHQLLVLRHVLDPSWESHLQLYEDASRGDWKVHGPKGPGMIRWTKGQPLGLGPSFVSFALSHNVILENLKRQLDEDCGYSILGDDVVIYGEQLASRYRKVLSMLGCPISEDKSISSDRVAEFAGRVITSSEVFQPYKWRKVSDGNFLSLAQNLGPVSLGLLTPRQRRVVRKISEVPVEYGGLGWNPMGKTFEDRVTENWETISQLATDDAQPYVMDNRGLNRLRLQDIRVGSLRTMLLRESEVSAPDPTRISADMDVRTRLLVDLRPSPERSENSLRPIGYIPEVKVSDPRGPSALERLERKLLPHPGPSLR